MKSLSNRLLALLSAAALTIAVGACKQPTTDTNTSGATPESQPSSAPENTPPAQPAEQPSAAQPGNDAGSEAGGGPADSENAPGTEPTEPGALPSEPTGGGPESDASSNTDSTEPTTPTGGGPQDGPGTQAMPAPGSSAKNVDQQIQKSRDKVNEGLDELRQIAANQAAIEKENTKRAAEDLQNRATEAQKSLESGIEKLQQEMLSTNKQ